MKRALLLVVLVGCGPKNPPVALTETCPATPPSDYEDTTETWTRSESKRSEYQQTVELVATFKSPDWRLAHAARDADHRGLAGEQRNQWLAQACAEIAGPYELELMLTTWDRRENDLDHGERSVWRVRLIDEKGNEIKPLEILKDKRPVRTVRAEFPALGDFAVPYIVRFPRAAEGQPPILGPGVHQLKLRMSGERGYVELVWAAQ